MEQYVMALDQGTTSSRAILFNRAGEIKSVAQKEFTQIYPQPGWVEHNPREIWSSQISVAAEAMAVVGAGAENISAIGITNQRETTIVWDKNTGEPVYNAIVWQCRRTSEYVDSLKAEGYDKIIKEKTGLIADAYFSGTKLKWILENVPGAREEAEAGNLLFGTVDSWLIWNLTGGKEHVTDYTNASRTMLYNIHELCWDRELLEKFNIPECMLPEVKQSSCMFGTTHNSLLGGEIKITGVAGDQQSALFGQCCFYPGELKNTYGTGCFLLMNTGDTPVDSKNGLLTTMAASTDGVPRYALEGSVFVAGAAVQWLRDEMKIVHSAAESSEIAESVPDTGGVYVVPAFVGLGAPYWNQYARGMVVGLTRGSGRAELVRATLESITYQACDVIRAMEQDFGTKTKSLKIDGGAGANDFLMQYQADILGADVVRPSCIETTALGAAYLAGLETGYWESLDDISANWKLGQRFAPQMSDAVRAEKLKGWKKAVKCAMVWTEED